MQRARLRQLGSVVALGCSVACASSKNDAAQSTPAPAKSDAGHGGGVLVARDGGGSGGDEGPPTATEVSLRDAGLLPLADAGDAGTAAGADASPSDADVPALDPAIVALVERFDALSARLAPLALRTMDFWLEHGPDATLGGFHATLDRQGNPIAPTDKGLRCVSCGR
jgi:hypothetical protein